MNAGSQTLGLGTLMEDAILVSADTVCTNTNGELVIDLSMKRETSELTGDTDDYESSKAVKVEMIPSAIEVKINEQIINTDMRSNGTSGDSRNRRLKRRKRSKKRKEANKKFINCSKETTPQSEEENTDHNIVITSVVDNSYLENSTTVHKESKEPVKVAVDSEVDSITPILNETPLKYTVLASTAVSTNVTSSTDISMETIPSTIINTSFVGANGKTVRPFKLYTQNRDLLSGIGLSEDNINSLAVALSGQPLTASSTTTVPVSSLGFAPLTVTNPLLPPTISSVGSTSDNSGTLLSSNTVPTNTLSSMRLMTLATEADKILKEKKRHNVATSDNGFSRVPLLLPTDVSGQAVGQLTVDAVPQDTLALIQQQTLLVQECDKSKVKKTRKRAEIPEYVKTENYWERRRKNNEAAKRSRDARRAKEDQMAIRAAILEHENTRLKIELNILKEETKLLRAEINERKKTDSK